MVTFVVLNVTVHYGKKSASELLGRPDEKEKQPHLFNNKLLLQNGC